MAVLGNRGNCAQPCRLPYELYENENLLNNGYLLSPRDNFGINFLPELIKLGIDSFKIEGRMKTPEYVGIVTKFYRKYIDLILENKNKDINYIKNLINHNLDIKNPDTLLTDKEEITQVFNRGGFSSGHLNSEPNHDLIFKEKPNNMGIYIGKIISINPNKGRIKLKLEDTLSIGDRISINDENYTVSELMIGNENYQSLEKGNTVTIGRMKGKIFNGTKIYRISSAKLNKSISPTFSEEKEFKKIPLNGELLIKKNTPITLKVWSDIGFYKNIQFTATSEIAPQLALNRPISKEKVCEQITKTGNTCFEFENLDINMSNNLFLPIKALNDIRRIALEGLENSVINKFTHNLKIKNIDILKQEANTNKNNTNISLLLNIYNPEFKYEVLKNIDKLYIPLAYFITPRFKEALKDTTLKFNTYIYMPNILKDNKINSINFENLVKEFNIKGFVISHISQIERLQKFNLELIGNYTLNIYNNFSIDFLKDLKLNCYTPSVELDKEDLNEILSNSTLKSEIIIYGKIPVMTNNYCFLGNSNKCYKNCKRKCESNNIFYLKDRFNCKFRILPSPTYGTTTIFNSKPLNLTRKNLNSNSFRIDILDENLEEIQNIIKNI